MPPVDDDIDLALPRPAAPSPTQSHGTVMAALLVGFVGLAFLLWLSVRGVGPFTATVVSTTYEGRTAQVTVSVTNEGSKGGHGKCRIERLTGIDQQPSHQFLSERVPGGGTITQTVAVSLAADERIGQVAC